MASIALLGLGRDSRLRSRIIRAESEVATWAVGVYARAVAEFDHFQGFTGPFEAGTRATIAENRIKNTGSGSGKINVSFDRYLPTGEWMNLCRVTTAAEVPVGACIGFKVSPETGCVFEGHPDCTGVSTIEIDIPTDFEGTLYFGLKCWSEDEDEPEYPTPAEAAAALESRGESVEQPTGAGRLPPCDSYGDTDGDGYIRPGVDAVLVQAYIVGGWEMVQSKAEELGVELKIDEDEFARRADVNGDGAISIRDAQLIDKYANGVTDTFPVCVPQEKPSALECLFPRIFDGKLFPRISCFLGGESFIGCLFPRIYCLMTMTR